MASLVTKVLDGDNTYREASQELIKDGALERVDYSTRKKIKGDTPFTLSKGVDVLRGVSFDRPSTGSFFELDYDDKIVFEQKFANASQLMFDIPYPHCSRVFHTFAIEIFIDTKITLHCSSLRNDIRRNLLAVIDPKGDIELFETQ